MLKEYFKNIKGGSVGFVGCGVSNKPILEMALRYGLKCTVRDKKPLSDMQEWLDANGVTCVYGEGYLDGISEGTLFLSPAVRPDLPQLLSASENGCYITTEMEEFLKYCPCKTIGITGSDGKTTTSTLIAAVLRESGKNVLLGGNIGKNLFCMLDDIKPDDMAVLELSSFQLMKMHFSPSVAVVTNIAPNHLDWHKDMQEYVDAKLTICRYQSGSDLLVLNADDKYADIFASKSRAKVIYTSVKRSLQSGVSYDGKAIMMNGAYVLSDDGIMLPGIHNRANLCQAIAATSAYADIKDIKKVAAEFAGVEHRCEFVRELGGVKYYNSSIDSSPSRTSACLKAFNKKVICICGGYDKKIPFAPLAEVCLEKAKYVVLVGATSDKIAAAFDEAGFKSYIRESSFEDAVNAASKIAEAGDIVVLSPACASFDLFKNFAERGNRYKELVNKL